MAGIGFELKKLFQKSGLFASFRAYGYAGVVSSSHFCYHTILSTASFSSSAASLMLF